MNDNYNSINLKTILRILFIRIFGNIYFNSIINIILPIVLSLLFEIPSDKRNKHFSIYIIIVIGIIIIENILYFIANFMRNKKIRWENLSTNVVNKISTMHIDTANNIFRMHKHTKASILENTYIDENHFNKLADFQQVSFLVCKAIYDMICNQLECYDCEVTVYQKFGKKQGERWDHVKMIAYATKDSIIPATYEQLYYINQKATETMFIQLFKQKTTDAIILHNHKAVEKNFKVLEYSREREEKICQYIGIPVKTNTNNVICVLQVDVSQKNILGKNYKEVKFFSDKVLKPFSAFLYNAYERDCVFNTLYEIWSNTLLNSEQELS